MFQFGFRERVFWYVSYHNMFLTSLQCNLSTNQHANHESYNLPNQEGIGSTSIGRITLKYKGVSKAFGRNLEALKSFILLTKRGFS